jgi:hypothetical protein
VSFSYPLDLPTSPGPRRTSFFAYPNISRSESPFTLKTQVQEIQGQKWGAEITLPVLVDRDEIETWQCFFLKLYGSYGTFLLGDSTYPGARGSVAGTPQVHGAGQHGETIAIHGMAASSANVFREGDFIQIGQRLYKILADGNSDASGIVTVPIFPQIKESPANNDTVITVNPKGLFRLSEDTTKLFDADEAKVFSMSFSAIEAY